MWRRRVETETRGELRIQGRGGRGGGGADGRGVGGREGAGDAGFGQCDGCVAGAGRGPLDRGPGGLSAGAGPPGGGGGGLAAALKMRVRSPLARAGFGFAAALKVGVTFLSE